MQGAGCWWGSGCNKWCLLRWCLKLRLSLLPSLHPQQHPGHHCCLHHPPLCQWVSGWPPGTYPCAPHGPPPPGYTLHCRVVLLGVLLICSVPLKFLLHISSVHSSSCYLISSGLSGLLYSSLPYTIPRDCHPLAATCAVCSAFLFSCFQCSMRNSYYLSVLPATHSAPDLRAVLAANHLSTIAPGSVSGAFFTVVVTFPVGEAPAQCMLVLPSENADPLHRQP